MKILIFLLLLVSPVFAQSETDLLRLENYNLRMELMAREFKDLRDRHDALRMKVDKEIAEKKPKEDKKDNKQ